MSDLRRAIVAHIISQARAQLLGLLIRRLREGQTLEGIAIKIGWQHEAIWEVFVDPRDLSLREIGELAWALDAECHFSLESA
jgi:hypothetical protein